jgi:hypothetical protein
MLAPDFDPGYKGLACVRPNLPELFGARLGPVPKPGLFFTGDYATLPTEHVQELWQGSNV